jgi:hypothetical protein
MQPTGVYSSSNTRMRVGFELEVTRRPILTVQDQHSHQIGTCNLMLERLIRWEQREGES